MRRAAAMLTEKVTLIPRHFRLLAFIRDYQEAHHYSPAIRDMMAAGSFASPNAVAEILTKFEKEGLITRVNGQPRTVAVTERARRLLRGLGRPTRELPPLKASSASA